MPEHKMLLKLLLALFFFETMLNERLKNFFERVAILPTERIIYLVYLNFKGC